MERTSSFESKFLEVHEFECTKDKDSLCANKSCDCAVELRRDMIRRCLDEYRKTNQKYYFLTLFHPYGICEAGRLSQIDLSEIKAFYLRFLRRAGINNLRVIGYVDIVLQDYIDGSQRKSRWHVHLHMILWADEAESSIKQKVYSVFNRFGNKRIAKLDRGTEPTALVGYIIKYVAEHKKKLISIKGWQCRPVYEIRGRFRRELNEFYSSCSIENAFILIGFRRYGINIRPWKK